MGGVSVSAKIGFPEMTVPLLEGTGKIPGLSGSASLRDRTVTLTLTNPSLQDTVTTRLRLADGAARLREARATVLTHEDVHATSTFEKPNELGLITLPVQVSGDAASLTIPKQAVVAVSLQLV